MQRSTMPGVPARDAPANHDSLALRGNPAFLEDLRVAPDMTLAALAVVAALVAAISEFLPAPRATAIVALALLAGALTGWRAAQERPVLGGYLATLLLAAGVLALSVVQRTGTPLVLLVIPTAIGTATLGPGAGAATAAVETLALLALGLFAPGVAARTELAVTAVAIWSILGTLQAMTHPARRLGNWLWEYYQRVQGALEDARDRSARLQQALDDLAHANRQLALANERTAAMRAIAEESQKSKAAFVAKVSHEFRTPLNMIIGLVDLLVETPEVYGQALPPALFEDLKIVHRNCEHLSSMVNDVLDLSQAEAGRLVLHQERVDLASIIDGALSVVGLLVEKKNLDLVVQLAPDLPQVYCDRTRIRQVILNLVSNAARFTERGQIAVRAGLQDDRVCISVADTGPGIPPEDCERIFEPFCQGSNNLWRDRGGSGLGLSISKQFIEMHGGRIWLESQVGAGTTFHFELPVSPPIGPATPPSRWVNAEWMWRERVNRLPRESGDQKPRVLVCDGTGHLGALLAHYADEAEIITSADLAGVQAALTECPGHAVLLNSPSPGDLPSLLEQARQIAPDTLVVGCSLPPPAQGALRAGASAYLVRPITRLDLMRALQALGRPIRRVLVVDDDPDVRQLLVRMLSANGTETDVQTAADGEEALAAMQTTRPDVVLLDLVMPRLDGWQTLARKSRDPELRDIPVILLTAQDPATHPPASDTLVASMAGGIPAGRLLRCALALSAALTDTPTASAS